MNKVASITHAYKTFDKLDVLKDVSVQLAAGTILGLIGPSDVEIFNTPMPNRKILAKIGYMGQSDALYEDLSAKENLTFFGNLMNIKGNELDSTIEKYLNLVDLQDFKNQLVTTYSGGMKRRLSLAITLLSNPNLLVLDEPTVGIDPSLRVDIWQQLRDLADKQKTIIVTTHVMDEAEKCDQVALIINGGILALGTPNQLKEQFKAGSIEEVFLKAEVKRK